MNRFFEKIDRDGFIYKDDPEHAYAEGEMIRSHGLSLKISALRPTDPGYKELLEELLQSPIEDSVAIAGGEKSKDEVIRLRNLNALIGRNNTGKTSFLMALSFVKRCIMHDVASAATMDQRPGFSNLLIRKDQPASFKLFFRIRGCQKVESIYIQYEITIEPSRFGSPIVCSEKIIRSVKDGDKIELVTILDLDHGKGKIRDSEGNFLKITEHKDCTEEELKVNEINSGMYVFNSEALNFSLDKITNDNSQGEYYLTDTIQIIKSTGLKVNAMPVDDIDEILGVNTKAQLAEAEKIMLSKNQ